jgi:hypothetical protein
MSAVFAKLTQLSKNVTHRLQMSRGFISIIALLMCSIMNIGCVIQEKLDDTYNQAHLGLNEWSLILDESQGAHVLNFNLGYLIGLSDTEGIDAIQWRYRLITPREDLIASHEEEMRQASEGKTLEFVQGTRIRILHTGQRLVDGERYVLWFVLKYRGEILHEQLFSITAGEVGGDPSWIESLTGGSTFNVSDLPGTSQPSGMGSIVIDMGSDPITIGGSESVTIDNEPSGIETQEMRDAGVVEDAEAP